MFILTLEVRALVLYCFLSGRTSNVFHPSQTKDGIKLAQKWLTFQTKDKHIREGNNKVLGKFAIKRGGHFSRGRPFTVS